jgi:hypothetical protein
MIRVGGRGGGGTRPRVGLAAAPAVFVGPAAAEAAAVHRPPSPLNLVRSPLAGLASKLQQR